MTVEIDADLPGGNIVVRGVDGTVATLANERRDTEGPWFYWCFRARFDAPGEYVFRFAGDGDALLGTRGPAVSRDRGAIWAWLPIEYYEARGRTFTYPAAAGEEAWFCVSMPYGFRELERCLAAISSPRLERRSLCLSRKGREVPLLRVRPSGNGGTRRAALFTARHHCCEMTANYVLEGVLRAALDAEGLPDGLELWVVPFVDRDGVEDGDQGKNRRPRDHARDYDNAPRYPETRAVMELVRREPIRHLVDVHCPWLFGKWNEMVYWVGPEPEERAKEVERFSALLARHNDSGVPYDAANRIPFGVDWNQADNYARGKTLPQWSYAQSGIRFAASLEIPYANVGEFTFTPATWMKFGQSLLRTLAAYDSEQGGGAGRSL